jgi:hypothetical protein
MKNISKLISLTYVSTPTYDISFLGLLRLLTHSFLNNQAYKKTGFLIFKNNQFAQILEGEEDAIEKIWFKIQQDNRHQDIQLLSKEYIDKRSFSKWSMLFPESQKVIEYFPDMAEAVQSNEIPANHPLFKIIQI